MSTTKQKNFSGEGSISEIKKMEYPEEDKHRFLIELFATIAYSERYEN